MLIFFIVIVGLSILILSHEAGHFFAAKFFNLKVDEFGFGFPPRMFAWRPFGAAQGKKGETEYSFNWLPFGGFVKIAGENGEFGSDPASAREEISPEEKSRLFSNQSAFRRSIIILAGVVMNFLIGWLLLSAVLMIGTPPALVITDVQPGSPAEAAGITGGDIIRNFSDSQSFISFVNERRGQPTTITVFRGGEELSFTATPRVSVGEKEGPLGVVLVDAGSPPQNPILALWNGLLSSFDIVRATIAGFYELVASLIFKATLLEGVVGPVGIFTVAQETGKVGIIYLFQLLSLISINLAVVNLIPFPALDGGRFFMILVEKIKGSPISRKTEAAINAVGFVFLIFLMVAITIRDIVNL